MIPAPNQPLAQPALQAFLTLTLSNAADQSRVANPLDRKRFCNDIFVSPEFFACIDVETIYAGLSPEKRDELWRMIAEKRGGVPSSAETKASRSKRRVTIIELPYTGSPAEEQVSSKKGKRVKSENPDGTIFYPPEIRLQTAQFVVRLKQQGVFQHYKSLQSMWEYGQLNCSAPVLQPSNTGWILRIPSLLLTFPRPMTCVQKILEIQESRKIADAEGFSVIQTGLEGDVKRIVGFLIVLSSIEQSFWCMCQAT